ncbi:GDSL-type esterase/lipase family protein [Oscillatoria sp. CS-180]|uniref:GDSL-type esterase/lipase family protein n=1 Tax=Oscillatoria sp. CS-180 TaxID=3021720 RepID=UPI00232B384B|nr:GDSL-type esterase/lipase family protein [Oscillatoria sp. CS-180]MDB9528087.1 GDSL-type esterase/lipase family protein [Oscillatoria sp. CS-180]
MTVLERLRKVPNWMLLSLAMNGLLFVAVVFSLRDNSSSSEQSNSVLPQANASVSSAGSAVGFVPELGDRHYLDYQQWVTLLQEEARATRNAPRLTVLLGDSISLWFPNNLLPGRRTWINQAISGEQSNMLLRRLDSLDDSNIESIFLMIGINDLIAGKPESQVTQNIQETVRYLKKRHPNADIVVQSILPHGAENATWEGRDRLLQLPNNRIQAVNVALEKVAAEQNVHYLDLYPLFANGEGALRPDLTTDGVHLNERGYLVWRTAIALLLASEFEE